MSDGRSPTTGRPGVYLELIEVFYEPKDQGFGLAYTSPAEFEAHFNKKDCGRAAGDGVAPLRKTPDPNGDVFWLGTNKN